MPRPGPPRVAQDGRMPERRDEPDLDAMAWQATAELLTEYHLMRPGDLARVLARTLRPLGVTGARVYLADLQVRHLVPLPSAEEDEAGQAGEALPIDATLAGRAYQTVTVQAGRAEGAHQVWIPLVDGTERLGVLSLTVADVSQATLARYRTLA